MMLSLIKSLFCRKYTSLAFIVPLLILTCQANHGQSGAGNHPYLVIVSLDGFRWDYPDSVSTPNLANIAKYGVKAISLIPSFPTLTFPNHYTLATGLYPDHHGIVQNQFYDPVLDLTYISSKGNFAGDGRFYGGEPIWVTAEKQHVKSACFYWVGSEAAIENTRPTYWKKYDPRISFENRLDTIIHWLSLPTQQRPHLLMVYFDQPDNTAHFEGPFSRLTKKQIVYVDSLIGIFRKKMNQLPIADQINLIITSDHGMGKVNNSMKVVIDKYIPLKWIRRVNGHNPMMMVDAVPGYRDSIKNKLSGVAHIKIWSKDEIPARLHFGSNARIGELVFLADSGYCISMSEQIQKGGTHGYDPSDTDMHCIFYAIGPAFKKGFVQPSFENIHIYSLMAEILGIVPSKNDGDLQRILGILSVQK